MAALSDTIDALLRLSVAERRTVLRALIEGLDPGEDGEEIDVGVADARRDELLRRLEALRSGAAEVVDDAGAWATLRARVARRDP